jgi:hypothetical protein
MKSLVLLSIEEDVLSLGCGKWEERVGSPPLPRLEARMKKYGHLRIRVPRGTECHWLYDVLSTF